MSLSVYRGVRVSGGTVTVHTGAGWFQGFLVSHNLGAGQVVTFYDNTAGSGTVLAQVAQPANALPALVWFPESLEFGVGLTVVAPAGVDVLVWAKGRA